jgi:phospholipase C
MRSRGRVFAYALLALLLGLSAVAGRVGPVSAQGTPIRHVVVIMMENHTLDNYFGDFPGVAGTKWGATEPPAPNPMPSDVLHNGPRTIAAIDGGRMDDFDPLGQVQYRRRDIPTYWAYAKHYGLGVNFFSAAETSSTPNHIAMVAAQTAGDFSTSSAITGCSSPLNVLVVNRDIVNGSETYGRPCYDISSLPGELTAAGLTWKMYGGGDIWNPLLYIQNLSSTPRINPLQIITDASNDDLPAVSFVAPNTQQESDHPPAFVQPAENFTASIINAIMRSPAWPSTAIFVTWDEFGGFYDHIPPPQVVATGMGPRVPLLVISRYAKPGYISARRGEFASFDKFIEANFGLHSLGDRDALRKTSNLMDFFDFSDPAHPPNTALIEPMRTYSETLQPPRDSAAALRYALESTLVPQDGGPGTSFAYTVVYSHPTAPVVHNVIVDGHPIVMNAIKKVGGNQVIYRAATTLPPGEHTYSFQFSDGTTTWNLPANNVPYDGPAVAPFDLANYGIGNSGVCQSGQPCTISVRYTSAAGHKPVTANALIDGTAHRMTAGAGKLTTGKIYRYTAPSLPPGQHYIQLEFNDGSGLRDFQETSMAVTPILLQNAKVSPASGSTSTVFTFSVVYRGPDPPSYADVVIDGATHPLAYVSGTPQSGATYSAAMSLPAGTHTFAFTAGDGVNAWSNPVTPAFYSGLKVTAAGQPTAHSRITAPPADDNPYAYDGN